MGHCWAAGPPALSPQYPRPKALAAARNRADPAGRRNRRAKSDPCGRRDAAGGARGHVQGCGRRTAGADPKGHGVIAAGDDVAHAAGARAVLPGTCSDHGGCAAQAALRVAPSRVGGRNRQPQERLPMRAHALEHKSACSPTTALPPISPLPGPSMPLVCPRQTSTVFFRPESLVHMHLQFLSHHETLSDGSGIGPSSSQSNSCLLGSRKNLRKRRLSSASRRALRDSARLARRGPKSERRRMLLRTGLGNSRSKRLASVEERLSRTQGNQNAGKILR